MWTKTEPVRNYLYSLLAPVVAVLTYYGVTSDEAAPLWVAVATAVLGVTGVEVARKKVTPMPKADPPRYWE